MVGWLALRTTPTLAAASGETKRPRALHTMEISYRDRQYCVDGIASSSMAIIAFVYMDSYLISDFTNKLASRREYANHGLTLTNQHHHSMKDGTSTG